MMIVAFGVLTMLSPLLVVASLLGIAAWRDRVRAEVVARQIEITDAIARDLGLVVAPLVEKRGRRSWRLRMTVPLDRSTLVARVVSIAHDVIQARLPGRWEIVLTAPTPAPPGVPDGSMIATGARLRRVA